MKRTLAVIVAALLFGAPLFAHRLDEYLQAIIIAVDETHIQASMRLIPGVAVGPAIIAAVDLDDDGVFSDPEQQTYARQVLRDMSVSIDGQNLAPVLRKVAFPGIAEMKEGLGEIHLEFTVDLPPGASRRTFTIKNHHQPGMSVYLMNCLIPQDHNLRLVAQNRNRNQSYYRIEYLQSGAQPRSSFSFWRSRLTWVLAPFAGVPGMFRLGMRHIAEGTDHLLFLLTLLLPAPLLADHSRWARTSGIRLSLVHIVRIVTAFTAGHSITLLLGASGIVALPSAPVEVLIAVSILVSAMHALRPLFPGREPMVAASFGLVHGLAFATTLQSLGVGAWQRLASILGFNLGIEVMQLIVVSTILPSLVLLSRTHTYAIFRLTGATFAALASVGWIVERLFGLSYSIDAFVNHVADCGPWIASVLALSSLLAWLIDRVRITQDVTEVQSAVVKLS